MKYIYMKYINTYAIYKYTHICLCVCEIWRSYVPTG